MQRHERRTEAIGAAAAGEMAADVRAGLSKPGQKELPSKYFYDEVGSALFDVITLLPEYGLTRAGTRLLRRNSDEIVDRLALPVVAAELGSGSGKKTRWLLEALCRRQPTTYHPIEISRAALEICERELSCIESISIVGFERSYLDGLLDVAARRRPEDALLVLFLGSTIGNFDRPAGIEFLQEVRRILRPGDALLVAADLEKPVPQVRLAYDDPTGVTAAFNLNLLARLNRELGADFQLANFRHEAVWNEGERRIEMHLRSLCDQTVRVPKAGLAAPFREGETIWTESCHKFNAAELTEMAGRTGFREEAQWIDREWPFAQCLWFAE